MDPNGCLIGLPRLAQARLGIAVSVSGATLCSIVDVIVYRKITMVKEDRHSNKSLPKVIRCHKPPSSINEASLREGVRIWRGT